MLLPMFVDVDVAKSTWVPNNNGFKYACKGGFVSALATDTVVCDKLSGRWMLGASELTQGVCQMEVGNQSEIERVWGQPMIFEFVNPTSEIYIPLQTVIYGSFVPTEKVIGVGGIWSSAFQVTSKVVVIY
jgi:hypothetical protein